MKLSYKVDLTGGIVSLIFGMILVLSIPYLVVEDIMPSAIMTSRTLPYCISAIFILCGLTLIIKSVFFKKDTIKSLDMKKEGIVALYLLCIVLYTILLKYSFLFATSGLSVVTLLFLKCKNKLYYGIAIGNVFALWVIFDKVLNVRLP